MRTREPEARFQRSLFEDAGQREGVELEAPDARRFVRALRQRLLLERNAGVDVLPRRRDSEAQLGSLRERVVGCRKCGLWRTRRQVVFGQGSPRARLMFVGEAPGQEEDRQGLAFVGRAGQLLTKIIEAIGLRREDVYIGNILKCRPPGNRTPGGVEIVSCLPYLLSQVGIIKPRIVVALGAVAAQALLATDEPIGSLRGSFRDLGGVKLMTTYHPAYLLRNPAEKRKVWEDMKKVRNSLAAE